MEWFHWFQLLFIAAMYVVVLERIWLLCLRAAASKQFMGAVRSAHLRGDRAQLAQLFQGGGGSWASEVGRILVSGAGGSADAAVLRMDLDDLLAELRYVARRRLGLVRVAATIAGVTGLLGAILFLREGFGGHTLLALQEGLAERWALRQGLLALALGMGLSIFCHDSLRQLQQASRRALDQALQIARLLGPSGGEGLFRS